MNTLIIYQEDCYTSNDMTFSPGTWHDHSFEQHECWDLALSNESILTGEIYNLFPILCMYVLSKYLFKNDLNSMNYDKHYCRFWNILIKIKHKNEGKYPFRIKIFFILYFYVIKIFPKNRLTLTLNNRIL